MTINQLEYFVMCAKHASLTKAAEELYTTQPHVSMVVKSLEQELGVALFRRKSRGVELTDEGRRIYDYAANALKNTELIYSACKERDRPCLRIATNSSSHMAVLLTNYYQSCQNENFSLQYTECGTEDMLSLVSEQEYDLGFLFVPEHKKSALFHMLDRRHMEFVPLHATDLVLYVGSRHPLYGVTSIVPEQLYDLRFIQLEDDFFAVEDLLYGLAEPSRKKRLLRRVVQTNSNHMMIYMLKHTDLCNLGSFWLKDMFRQYDFGRIAIQGFEGKVSFGYVRHNTRSLGAQERAFLEFLRTVMLQDHWILP